MARRRIPEEELSGKTFERLIILRYATSDPKHLKVVCLCSCGRECEKLLSHVLRGATKSCGCLKKSGINAYRTHGLTGTPEHRVWKGIRRRCNGQNRKDYERYGGKGITVCKRWSSFENFLSDMGKRPSNKHSIERRNNTKGYSPANCYWATDDEQRNNKRTSRIIKIGRRKQTLRQWCDEFDAPYARVHDRIDLLGWDPLRALQTPSTVSQFTHNGRTMSIRQWCIYLELEESTVYRKIRKGATVREALGV